MLSPFSIYLQTMVARAIWRCIVTYGTECTSKCCWRTSTSRPWSFSCCRPESGAVGFADTEILAFFNVSRFAWSEGAGLAAQRRVGNRVQELERRTRFCQQDQFFVRDVLPLESTWFAVDEEMIQLRVRFGHRHHVTVLDTSVTQRAFAIQDDIAMVLIAHHIIFRENADFIRQDAANGLAHAHQHRQAHGTFLTIENRNHFDETVLACVMVTLNREENFVRLQDDDVVIVNERIRDAFQINPEVQVRATHQRFNLCARSLSMRMLLVLQLDVLV